MDKAWIMHEKGKEELWDITHPLHHCGDVKVTIYFLTCNWRLNYLCDKKSKFKQKLRRIFVSCNKNILNDSFNQLLEGGQPLRHNAKSSHF